MTEPLPLTDDYDAYPNGAVWSKFRRRFLKIRLRPRSRTPTSILVIDGKRTVMNLNEMVLQLFGPSALVDGHISAITPHPESKGRKTKLTADQVASIKRLLNPPYQFTLKDLGIVFNVSPSTILQIRRGVTWKSIAPGVAIPAQGESDAETDC